MRDFRNKNKIADQKKPSSNLFDSYVDKLVANGGKAAGEESSHSPKAAHREMVRQCHEALAQQKRDHKDVMNKLKYHEKQMRRQARGKSVINVEDII